MCRKNDATWYCDTQRSSWPTKSTHVHWWIPKNQISNRVGLKKTLIMASIHNVDLDIKKGKKSSTVIVTYKVCFTTCELRAGFYFSDYAHIWGSDPGPDDRLFLVGRSTCYRPNQTCITRSYRRVVPNSLLNEDKGFWFINKRDEVYARACVSPVEPTGDCANSTLHHDFF